MKAFLSIFLSLCACSGSGKVDVGSDEPAKTDTATNTETSDESDFLDADADGFGADEDCNDEDATINPGATEVCDGLDNDCDGSIDEELLSNFYTDMDGDGYGDEESIIEACEVPEGFVSESGDCDDSNDLAYPGAAESCREEVDLNCDGEINYLPWPTTCEVHLVEQNVFSSLDLTGTGLSIGSISINGSAVKSAMSHDLDQFLGFTEEQIANTFGNYVSSHSFITDDTIVILDMEHPVHPKFLYQYLDDPVLFTSIIEAFRLRINVARSILPNNQFAMYGTVIPHGQGSESGFAQSREGYVAAGEAGLYDDLDYLVPVIYHRFGETDPSFEDRLDRMTHQALSESAALTRTDGTSLPLFPLLSLQIFNGNSLHHGEAPLPIHVDAIIEDVLQYPEVALFGFWTGTDTSSPVGDIPSFFESVELVPIPDCTCPGEE